MRWALVSASAYPALAGGFDPRPPLPSPARVTTVALEPLAGGSSPAMTSKMLTILRWITAAGLCRSHGMAERALMP
jgi:hypothetical protein